MLLVPLIHTLGSYLRRPKKREWIRFAHKFRNNVGLEIGGPSSFFKPGNILPIYVFANQIDVVNFSSETVWEGAISEGYNYHYFNNKVGYQYISEATNLSKIKNQQYDFLLSCHSLEHIANPLKALFEWKRVLKTKGKLVLILPYKTTTFDNKRPFTEFNHILEDFKNDVDETDETHFDEIIKLHDGSKEKDFNGLEDLKERLSKNVTLRCAHHHVFNEQSVAQMLKYVGFSVLKQETLHQFNLVTIAELT